MADYTFEVDFKQLVAAQKAMDNFTRKNNASIKSITNVLKDNKTASDVSVAALRRGANAVTSLERQKTRELLASETQRKRVAKQKELEEKREATRVAQLTRLYNPLTAAANKYQLVQKEIAEAHQRGVISANQHEAALESLKLEYEQFTAGKAGIGNQFVDTMGRSGKSMSRFTLLTQQGGYQVGDFLVQVQSGTNALVALGQQGTQMAGTLTLLGGKFVAIGTAIGVVLPLLTAVGALWMRSRQEADKTSNSVDTLADKIERLTRVYKEFEHTRKAVSLGISEDELTGVETVEELTERVKRLREEYQKLTERAFAAASGGGISFDYLFKGRELDSVVAQLKEAEQALERIRYKEFLEESSQFRESLRESRLAQIDLFDELYQRTEDWKASIASISFDGAKSSLQGLIADLNLAYGVTRGIAGIFNHIVANAENLQPKRFNFPGQDGPSLTSRTQVAFTNLNKIPLNNFPVLPDSMSVANSSGGSGGGSKSKGGSQKAKETSEDYLAKLNSEIEQKRELINLYGEEKSVAERVIQLREESRKKELSISEERLTSIALEEQRIKTYVQRQEAIFTTFTNTLEDSMMQLVEGATSVGDAFRNILRTMILEIYKQQAVKPFVSSVGSGFGSLLGNIFPFADGGVVNGPTTFPMKGGTGLMGEAGPEAIMPLKRGADGKLGVQSSGERPIYVTMNVSTPDARSFERSRTQVAAGLQKSIRQGERNS